MLRKAVRWVVGLLLTACLIVVAALVWLNSSWGHDAVRQIIVREANQYLTATLEIDGLSGSFVRGINLRGVRLSQNGETIVAIDGVSVSYSIRELYTNGTTLRRLALTRPRIVARREPGGRWNLASLVRRDPERPSRPIQRPLHFTELEITDGDVSVSESLTFGAFRVPTHFADLDTTLSFDYGPGAWTLDFANMNWQGQAPDLTVQSLRGSIGSRGGEWMLEDLHVTSPASVVSVNGTIDRRQSPAQLHLTSNAAKFAFSEWAAVVPVLSRITTSAGFDATIDGTPDRLKIALTLDSNAGKAEGTVELNTDGNRRTLAGSLDMARFNLAPWIQRPDRPSDITGHVLFRLRFEPGSGIPRGTFDLDETHVRFMEYEADRLAVHGEVDRERVTLGRATAIAYGANLALESGSIEFSSPYRFRFTGVSDGVDLRQIPANVPVPHVESTLRFAFDVTGQFVSPHIRGDATFRPSVFLGARLGDGAVGTIDTSVTPFTYSGEGDLEEVDLHRFGVGLDVGWLQEPRYAGRLTGHFKVSGTGGPADTLSLTSTGHLAEATVFGGTLRQADVTFDLRDGSLDATYGGQIARINPAMAMQDPRFNASLTGSGRASIHVNNLLTTSPALGDYTIDTALALEPSTVRSIALTSANVVARLDDGTLAVQSFKASGPAVELTASGRLELDDVRGSDLSYAVLRANLTDLRGELGRDIDGQLTTEGRMTGTLSRPELVGQGTLSRLSVSGVSALSTTMDYRAALVSGALDRSTVHATGRVVMAEAFGQALEAIDGTVDYADRDVSADLTVSRTASLTGELSVRARLDLERQHADISTLMASIGSSAWALSPGSMSRVDWTDRGVTVRSLAMVDAKGTEQQFSVDGSWYPTGGSNLSLIARHLSLDALTADSSGPARYGGTIDLNVVIQGSRAAPFVTGEVRVTEGRVFKTPYESLSGRLDYVDGRIRIDLRIDQAPGIWLTATGSVPGSIFQDRDAGGALDVTIESSRISLGLIEGATSVIREAEGALQLNVKVIGTANDPHFDGRVAIEDAAFIVSSSGARYKNGRVALRLSQDRVDVETFHLEDSESNPLDLHGSLGTHELRVGDVTIDVRARDFKVLNNDYGRMDIDAELNLRGQFESPAITGRMTVTRGELSVDTILDRTMLQLYATEPVALLPGDAIVAINPWDRIGFNVDLHVPGTLRFVGDNVQVSPGTPLGIGDFNLRAIGDLNLYKDPAQPMYVTGSLDQVTGTYSFQGRRFELDPSSSINFRGDLQPELYVSVTREISAVETRVTILGPLNQPELRLSSSPPLDASDILSLIVFNTSANELSGTQQEELAVRAGTLAAGFVAAPLVTALERSLGLDTLEITPSADGQSGARVTIGNEIAPGLVARFSRQFGDSEYDEATLEYYLSRILRIRATFSDASTLTPRSPFRRTERAGIDLLFFFSF